MGKKEMWRNIMIESQKKIMMIFGTRPEAIKMAPLYLELKKRGRQVIVCVTAQHREMLDQVLELFEIIPEYDLNIMKQNQTLDYITSEVLIKVGKVLDKEKPDILLVHGDTTTTFSAALSAFYRRIPVGHVEAGLRTDNIYSPFPEEINRRLTDDISTYYFAPTQANKNRLLAEGKKSDNIFVTENTVIDAFLTVANSKNCSLEDWIENFPSKQKIITLTAHRRESFGIKLRNIFRAIKDFIIQNKNYRVIYPVHPNPNVLIAADEILKDIDRIDLIKPLPYLPFVHLLKNSHIVLTDSGGIQEEVPSLGIPVLVLREETERLEAIEAGTVKLVGTDYKIILEELQKLDSDEKYYANYKTKVNPYGTGNASNLICDVLENITD